jgi:hypothetical protein
MIKGGGQPLPIFLKKFNLIKYNFLIFLENVFLIN